MDFTFTEEQQAAAEAARAVFADVAPDGVPSPALTPGAVAEDIDRQLWNELARTDLLGLTLSPDHGGAGLDPIALCLVLRESAKVLARVPLLESCAVAMAVQRYAGSALAAELLPPVGRGERILTVGANGRTGHDPAELAVTARRYGESGGASAGAPAGCSTACSPRFPGPERPTGSPSPRTPGEAGRSWPSCPAPGTVSPWRTRCPPAASAWPRSASTGCG